MNRRILENLSTPQNTVTVPLLAFGCMRLPLNEDKTIDRAATAQMVKYAMENGVNYFDTAYMYHNGESELVMGEILKNYPRESFVLASKMPLVSCETIEDVERIFDDQLKKCQVEYFDFYLMHAVERHRSEKIKNLGVYEFLDQKRKEGKIKYLGFSFHDVPDVLEDLVKAYKWDFVQLQLNYLDWSLQDAKRQYEILEENGIACFVMEPIRGGYLANLPQTTKAIFDAKSDISCAAWALKWVANLPNVKTILSGMSNFEQLVDNIQTLNSVKALTDDEIETVNNVIVALKNSRVVACTSCDYCIDCPAGVHISKVFELYNRNVSFGEEFWVKHTYTNVLTEKQRASSCINCGICKEKCPQHIDIPEKLKLAHKTITAI